MTPLTWYALGVPANLFFMVVLLRRRDVMWLVSAAGGVYCVGKVVLLSGVMG